MTKVSLPCLFLRCRPKFHRPMPPWRSSNWMAFLQYEQRAEALVYSAMAGERASAMLRCSLVVLPLEEEEEEPGEPHEEDDEDEGDVDLRGEGLRVVRLADCAAAATRFVRLAGEAEGEEAFLRAW